MVEKQQRSPNVKKQLPIFDQKQSKLGSHVSVGSSKSSQYDSRGSQSTKSKQFKVICVGESMVGKTSFIQRYIDNMFLDHGTQPTLSWDFKIKQVQLGEGDPKSQDFQPTTAVRMFVWDTAGQERFRQIARMYYNEVCGAFVCFDLTDEDSFNAVNFWMSDLNANAPKSAVKMLCGFKLDLVQASVDRGSQHSAQARRAVSLEQVYQLAKAHKMGYLEISSKTGHNVQEAFYKMAYEINEVQKKRESAVSQQPGIYDKDKNQLGGQAYKVSLRPKVDHEEERERRGKKCGCSIF